MIDVEDFLRSIQSREELVGVDWYQLEKRIERQIREDVKTLELVRGLRKKTGLNSLTKESREDKAKKHLSETIKEMINRPDNTRKTVRDYVNFKPFHESQCDILKAEFGLKIHPIDVKQWIIELENKENCSKRGFLE